MLWTLICSCGLVMKEDITQLFARSRPRIGSCGLVMKEDITQLLKHVMEIGLVVVW